MSVCGCVRVCAPVPRCAILPKLELSQVIRCEFSPSRLSLEDTQQWSQSLERLLESKCRWFHPEEESADGHVRFYGRFHVAGFCSCASDGLATFRNFLKSEYSDENIEFWLTCEDYKKIKSSFRMSSRAKKIYEQFIKAESPKEVR